MQLKCVYFFGALPDDVNESVATHSSRLQPSIICMPQLQTWCLVALVSKFTTLKSGMKAQVGHEIYSSPYQWWSLKIQCRTIQTMLYWAIHDLIPDHYCVNYFSSYQIRNISIAQSYFGISCLKSFQFNKFQSLQPVPIRNSVWAVTMVDRICAISAKKVTFLLLTEKHAWVCIVFINFVFSVFKVHKIYYLLICFWVNFNIGITSKILLQIQISLLICYTIIYVHCLGFHQPSDEWERFWFNLFYYIISLNLIHLRDKSTIIV